MNRAFQSHPQRTQFICKLACIAPALALSWQLALLAFVTLQAAFGAQAPVQSITRIHILPFTHTDATVLESNGRFDIIDSGEDSDHPGGTGVHSPFRDDITRGGSIENSVISCLRSLKVNSSNLEFHLGTHPHNDHMDSADEVVREFCPRRVYISEYQDSFISDESRLWDNQYVYDRAIAAAKETGGTLIQNLNPNTPIEPSSNNSQGESTLDVIGSIPKADMLDTGTIIKKFGIDATDQRDPYNSETLPEAGIADIQSSNSNLMHECEYEPSTTGSPCLTLGDVSIEIVNYSDDHKFNPVHDANYFSWGAKVEATGSTAFLLGNINNYDEDEGQLAKVIGHVDLLKLRHHGSVGSNAPLYPTALPPTYAIQTGYGANLPEYATSALDALQIRYFTTPEATNTMRSGTIFHSFSHSPHMAAYQQGLKQRQQRWENVDSSWYWFDNSVVASENTWLEQSRAWHWLTESGRMATGWANTPDGMWYYFDPWTGAIATGSVIIDETPCIFDASGACINR